MLRLLKEGSWLGPRGGQNFVQGFTKVYCFTCLIFWVPLGLFGQVFQVVKEEFFDGESLYGLKFF
jgi:hypothetical protein